MMIFFINSLNLELNKANKNCSSSYDQRDIRMYIVSSVIINEYMNFLENDFLFA